MSQPESAVADIWEEVLRRMRDCFDLDGTAGGEGESSSRSSAIGGPGVGGSQSQENGEARRESPQAM